MSCVREVESKKPETDISSSSPSSPKVEVPKVFKCTLSNKIMVEPVIIASGQTYEKRYITEWLRHERTCPKSNLVLSHLLLTPNHLVDELITQWCRENNYDRLKPSDEIATEMFTYGIDSLLQRISSPSSSVSDKTEAAKELRNQTKKFSNVRRFFVTELPDSITRLLSPLSASGEAVDSNPELQENIVTTLFNISIVEKNKTVIAENPLVIPLLIKFLKQGTPETRINSAATLLSLSAIDSNKIIMGNSEVLKALIDLIEEGDSAASLEAASVVFNLCILLQNREKAVLAGLIPVVTKKIKEGSNVAELLAILSLISTNNRAIEEMSDLGFMNDLFSILRKPSCSVISENAVVIVFNMCERNRDMSGLKSLREEENQYGTFTKLAKQGSDRAVRKAEAILKWLKRYDASEKRHRGNEESPKIRSC
ncbi:putative U-box domain-containing protein 46 [Eutrema salsugineum]|nr:putative U-box domain-containing protein 46 [Eutrema salsugineum]